MLVSLAYSDDGATACQYPCLASSVSRSLCLYVGLFLSLFLVGFGSLVSSSPLSVQDLFSVLLWFSSCWYRYRSSSVYLSRLYVCIFLIVFGSPVSASPFSFLSSMSSHFHGLTVTRFWVLIFCSCCYMYPSAGPLNLLPKRKRKRKWDIGSLTLSSELFKTPKTSFFL